MTWRSSIIALAFLAGLAIPVAGVCVPKPCCSGANADCKEMCLHPSGQNRADWCRSCCNYYYAPDPDGLRDCYIACDNTGMDGPCDCSC